MKSQNLTKTRVYDSARASDQILKIYNSFCNYATAYHALPGVWPVQQWFPSLEVVTSGDREFFDSIFPVYLGTQYYRGHLIYEKGKEEGLVIYQPFLPPKTSNCPPVIAIYQFPTIDWIEGVVAILIKEQLRLLAGLENNSRVVWIKRKEIYNGHRQKA